MKTEQVYVLHFERRYPRGKRPQHYTGSAINVAAREQEHRRVWERGQRGEDRAKGDCALIHAMGAEGIGWRVTLIVPGGRQDERGFKNRGSARQYCPECAGAERARRAAAERKRRARRQAQKGVGYAEAA